MKIATHNSCTGEKCKGLLSWLLTPFAKCQTKTIKEQYDAGCRWFDLRFKCSDEGLFEDNLIVAHGPWKCSKSFIQVLNEINSFEEACWVGITYEGHCEETILKFIKKYIEKHYKLNIAWIAIKKPWTNVWKNPNMPPYRDSYIGLSTEHWQHWIPIPWLWDKVYFKKHQFDDEKFTFTDFL